MLVADMVLIGTPVYNDMPTPKIMAFLSRLSFIAERKNREFLKGKKVKAK
jgi:multimeric flavodoxin WrbA